jgi:hypothetical protein
MTEYLFDIFQKDKIYYQKIDFIRLNKDKCEKKKKNDIVQNINKCYVQNQSRSGISANEKFLSPFHAQ